MMEFQIFFLQAMLGVILGQIFLLACLWVADWRDRARLRRFDKPVGSLRRIDYISTEPWPRKR